MFVPLGLLAAENKRMGPHASRGLVQVLAVFGFVVVVSAIYLVVVLGLGHAPKTTGDKEVLALSMVASGVAALIFVPVRARFLDSATRFVYGSREAPDEVLRTFGSRLTRAIPMDELLLQLAESLRKTMGLASAEVYTGSGEVLERTASVPDLGPGSLVVSPRERPVVTRAGVSGTAWASVWLPALLREREAEQIRVAPISHAGELLGLIVVERTSMASAFSEDDDRVLADLARQVGLALHNSQLDTALQTTLDEVRKQADALRESRARIVASGDAERRRVERNLHDGAQQHLVALAVNLRLAKDIIVDDQEAGMEMLDQLAGEVQETIQELRELAHGIYPPLLVDSGLVEALRAAANRNPLPVDIVADGIGRYPSETEAAIYFCCLEALQNAAKHAPDARVEVRLWEESGGLLFSVSDDGPGFDPEHGAARSRLHQHGGPSRRHRRNGPLGVRDREGIPGPRLGPARLGTAGSGGDELLLVAPFPETPKGIGAQVLLVEVGAGATRRHLGRQVARVVGGAQDHDDLGVPGHHGAGRLDPVHLRHVDVHQDQSGTELLLEGYRLGPAGGLAHQLELGGPLQHRLHGSSEGCLVVDDQDGEPIAHACILSRRRVG